MANLLRTLLATFAITFVVAGQTITGASPAFGGRGEISTNTYLDIYGSGLSDTTRLWSGADFQGNRAPTTLDGVSVTVDGLPAYVYYVSPRQVNVNVPELRTSGRVAVQVRTPRGTSPIFQVTGAALSPTLQAAPQFNIAGIQYVVAQAADFRAFVAPPIRGVTTRAAQVGETIILYALGCGRTSPATLPGTVNPSAAALTGKAEVFIGDRPAEIRFGARLEVQSACISSTSWCLPASGGIPRFGCW